MAVYGLRGLTSIEERALIGDVALNAPGLIKATTTSKLKVANTVKFITGGLWASYAAADNITWGTAASTGLELRDLADLETAYYTISVSGAGVIKVNGPVAAGDPLTIYAPVDGTTLFGILKVVNSQTTPAVFNPGTTLLDVAGIACTFYDYRILPTVETL